VADVMIEAHDALSRCREKGVLAILMAMHDSSRYRPA
jgi:hypothetical protein